MNATHRRPPRPRPARLILGLLPLVAMGCAKGENADDARPGTETPAELLVARSIAFHDPAGTWGKNTLQVEGSSTDANGEVRTAADITIHPDADRFELRGRYGGSDLEYRTEGDTWRAKVDGETNLAPDVLERMRLQREGGLFWRSYYGFLISLPMKLRDPGTHIGPEPMATTFNGKDVLAIRVGYDPEVGQDTWYFYFDRESAALVGCRFYHDESADDGEYIVLEGLIEADGLRLPHHRRWYVNEDDRFLGADEIVALNTVPAD